MNLFERHVKQIRVTLVSSMELDNDPTHKAHRKSKTGVKANKKKAAKQKKLNQDADAMRDRNPKVKI